MPILKSNYSINSLKWAFVPVGSSNVQVKAGNSTRQFLVFFLFKFFFKQITSFNCSPNLSWNDDKANRQIGIETESVESTAITATTKRKDEFRMISNNQMDGLAAGHWHHVTGCGPPSNVTHSLIWLHGLGIVILWFCFILFIILLKSIYVCV